MKVLIAKQGEFTPAQIQDFFDTVNLGGQIPIKPEVLLKNIKNAEYLAFCFEGKFLTGIAAIKNPQQFYKVKIGEKTENPDFVQDFHYEIGYCVTLPLYRGKGVCTLLVQELMKQMPNTNLWASTRTYPMKKLFITEGFELAGNVDSEIELYTYKA